MKKVPSLFLMSLLSALALMSCSGLTSSSVSESSVSSSASETSSESSSTVVTYTITFEENGGSTVTDITQEPGSSVSVPVAPTKTGYAFAGWYSDSALTSAYTFSVMPSQNITLYAKWQINQYTITFQTNGGSSIAPLTQDYLSSVSAPEIPTKTGYSFVGWYSDSGLTTPYAFTTMPVDGMTVYAKWEINDYTISFNSNGGSTVAAITQDYLTTVVEPEEPAREGYLFEGWFSDEALTVLYTFSTMPAEDLTLYAKWEIDPMFGVLTIAEYKLANDTLSHEVAGVVIFAASEEMGFIIIADETETLLAMTTGTVKSGDFVKLNGTLGFMNDFPFLTAEDPSTTLVAVLDHDRPIPLAPTEMELAAYNVLDPNAPANWIQYIELTGTLTIDAVEHTISLFSGTDAVPLMIIDMETYLFFKQYEHFEISVRGIVIPNFDAEPMLMFFFTRVPTDISMDYTPTELVTMMSQGIADYYSANDYIAGEILDLPVDHPLVPVAISYETFGTNEGLFNVSTFQVSPTIESETLIDIRVTVTLPEANASAEFQLHIVPLVPTTIATFLTMPDDETTYFNLQGVIIHLQLENNFMMIADTTGVCYVITNNTSLAIGDEAVVYGVKMSNAGMSFLANDASLTVRAILSSGNPMPLTPTPISITAFAALDINEPTNTLRYFSITGTLHEDVQGHRYYLSDGTTNIPIYVPYEDAYASLAGYVDTSVIICGLSTPVTEQGFMMLVYFNLPGTIASA